MNRLFVVSLALATVLASSSPAKADQFIISFSGTCTQGAAGCNNQNGNSDPNGASFTAASGTQVSITGTGTLQLTGSGPFNITSGTFTIDGQTATLITQSTPGTGKFNDSQGELVWTYGLSNGITQSGYYGLDQTNPSNPNGANAVAFDNMLTPGGQPPLSDLGLSFLVPTLGTDGAIFNIYSFDGQLYWNEVIDGGFLIDPINGAGGDPLTMLVSPEPSSLLLLGTGLLLVAAAIFRKVKTGVSRSL